jgi:dipeptidyl aminopeptidase/acylaminoacyl peptidase
MYVVSGGEVYFSNFADQRIYKVGEAGQDPPQAVTPEGEWFYADAVVDGARRRLICVREDHTQAEREPVNALVSIPLDAAPSAGDVLASGYDFYSTPRLSPDGSRLAWLCWRHPQMPWDGTELWVADVAASGTLANATHVAGGDAESIYQPGWAPDGALYFVSDRDGWWRLYRSEGSGVRAVLRDPPSQTEFGRPQWIFGSATWAFAGPSRLVVSYTTRGRWHLAMIDTEAGTLVDVPTDFEPREWLTATPTHAIAVAGTATAADAVVCIRLDTGEAEMLQAASAQAADARFVSVPEAIEFPTGSGGTAHAFYYAPHSADEAPADAEAPADVEAPAGDRPPLIVISHGGPTTAASAAFDLRAQFWTSRGFAVVDVNYGGSSGFGRPYRQRLNGSWGIVDVEDCVNAARHLVRRGKADPDRLIIRGGSAGGYTTLAALAFHPDVFKAGASYYGVSDVEVLAQDTHKFESRYLDTLIGPYPAAADVYRARSPIHFVDQLSCALILFQGLEDRIVPPNQSQMMADAVRAKGLPVAYLTFEGEQHGFRKAETIVRCLEAELSFYGAVFGFTPADAIDDLSIDNLRR